MEKVIKCFIASPGDTKEERAVCLKVIEELNRGIGKAHDFRLESLTWEHNSRPGFGEYSQKVISDQLGYDYQIFIGIMYQKFGTPTTAAGSGTEEEFNNAYSKWKNKDDVEIMFYFNRAAVDPYAVDRVQFDKVREFRDKLGTLGGYHWPYNGVHEFEKFLRDHLNDHLNSKFKSLPHVTEVQPQNKKKNKIAEKLEERLKKALISFDSQPAVWIEPILSPTNKISTNADENYSNRFPIEDVINNPTSTIIKAPRQFGLTCLAHYLVKLAWEKDSTWVYLDCNNLKVHNIAKAPSNELIALGIEGKNIDCIVLDSWNKLQPHAFKKLKALCDANKDTPIIVLESIDDARFLEEVDDTDVDRSFTQLFLLALPRTQVREVIKAYNKQKEIGEEDSVLIKILSDMEVLNLHRTPHNCITLLKVAENKFDESPVNRTGMLETVLFILFNMDGVPTYRTKPDLKDCEFILGKLCEDMIRNDSYEFSRDVFITKLNKFCEDQRIDVEVDVVFDVLIANNIIIQKGSNYGFKATYWILFFAAKRMHMDEDFREYIYSSKKYTSFPEIIEFYTGIDRNRADAIDVLCKDISATCDLVISKVGLSDQMNPLSIMKWMPTDEQIDLAQKEIGDSVVNSTLPDAIKDQHADKSYNQVRPYNQTISSFLEDYSVYNLMQKIKAAARALRNSDYVNTASKTKILKEIIRSWEQISIVLFVIAPVLASKGKANLEGASFQLDGDFGDTFDDRMHMILQLVPTNVVGFFKDDLFSNKIAPLLYDEFKKEPNELKKHSLALFFVFTRPKKWKTQLEEYIVSLNKNSFYLYDLVNNLKSKYSFDFASEQEVREMNYLIRLGLAKHSTGEKKPNYAKIAGVPNHELPLREVKDI